MKVSRIKGTALWFAIGVAGFVAGATVAPGKSGAQSYETGGIQLTFGVALRLEANDNRAFDPVSAGTSTDIAVPLSFGVLSETRVSRLALDLGGVLRRLETPGTGDISGFETPSLALSYDRFSAAARFAVLASVRDTDLSDGSVLTEDGLDLISGSATRRNTTLETSIDWRDDAPLGFGLLARVDDIDYRNGIATDLGGAPLNGSRRRTLRASVRADLNAASRLDLALTWRDLEIDGTPGRRETLSFTGDLTVDRPLGALTAAFGVSETRGDPRIVASLGRSLAFPLGEVSGRIGAARGASGELVLTGAVDLRRELPRGTLSLGLSRDLANSDETDTERLSTRLSVGYLQELTPLSRLRLSFDLTEIEDTATGDAALNGTIDAVYDHDLTEDWGLNAGYRHRYGRDSGNATARSNAIFLELRRDFVTRF